MKNISDITAALVELVEDSAYFGEQEFTIERSEPVPDDPNRLPWLGVFRDRAKYNPRSLGVASVNTDTDNWEGKIKLGVVIKDQEITNLEAPGADLEDRIERHVKEFLDILVTNTEIANTVEMVSDIEVSYTYERAEEDDRDTMYMYGAIIEVELEVITS